MHRALRPQLASSQSSALGLHVSLYDAGNPEPQLACIQLSALSMYAAPSIHDWQGIT